MRVVDLRGRILGLDCLYGDELCGEFGDIWGGEGVGGWVESEGCVLTRAETKLLSNIWGGREL